MDRTWPAPLKSAIRELAESNAELHVATSITAGDAGDFIDDDVLTAYWAVQRAANTDGEAWLEIYAGLPQPQTAQLHAAVICLHPAGLRTLHDAVRAHVAKWLADEATGYQVERNLLGEDDAPTDPYLAERRAFTRRVNAENAAWRRLP